MRGRTELMFQVAMFSRTWALPLSRGFHHGARRPASGGYGNPRYLPQCHGALDRATSGAHIRKSVADQRSAVASIIDVEQARVGLLFEVDIVERHQRVVALRVGDQPLLELEGVGVEHQPDFRGAAER